MNNLTQRIITAAIGAVFMIGGILWNDYSLCAVLFLLSLAVHFEFIKTVQQFKGDKRNNFELILLLLLGCYFFYAFMTPLFSPGLHFTDHGRLFQTFTIFNTPVVLIFITTSLVLFELLSQRPQPFQNIGLNMTGIFYCIMPFALLEQTNLNLMQISDPLKMSVGYYTNTPISDMDSPVEGKWFILGYFLIIWSNDSFAYFAGRLFGKHKLFERISPNKTWEGFFGGMLAGLLCAYILSCYIDFLSRIDWIIIAFIISIFGTLGDLAESKLKRSLQIKDSGNILPGHGGFLDRFDATLLAAPAVFVYIMLRF